MSRALKLLLLLVPLAAMLAICIDTPYHRLPQAQLTGVELASPLPAWSLKSFWDSRFQPDFEKYFESQLSLRSNMVRFDNSVALAAFHQIAAHTRIPIVLGKDDTLFEMNYVNNANHVSQLKNDPPPPSPYSVDEAATKLGRATRAFRRLGIDFVLVLYPHKAWIQPERVPPQWRLAGGREAAAAGLDRLREALRRNGVPVVDGVEVLTELKRRSPRLPLYNRGGTHWTDAAACATAQRLVEVVAPAAKLICSIGAAEPAHGVDMDLAELINVWDVSRFREAIPVVNAALAAPLPGGPRPTLVNGTSFSAHLIRLLSQAGVMGNVVRTSYFRTDQTGAFDWSRVLQSKLIIFEQSQWSFVTVNVTDFLDALERRVPQFAEALKEEP